MLQSAIGPVTISTDPRGDIIISGWFVDRLTLDDGDATAASALDPYLLKMSGADGATSKQTSGAIWLQTFAGDDTLESNLLGAVDSSGSILFAATITKPVALFGKTFSSVGAGDIVFGKVSTRAEPIFLRQVGDSEDQIVSRIVVDGEGALLVKGTLAGTLELPGGPKLVASASTPFIFRWQPTDDPGWARTFEKDSALVLGVDNSDTILSARFKGTFDFGNGSQIGGSGQNLGLARLRSDGSIAWSRIFEAADNGAIILGITSDTTGELVLAGVLPGSIDFGAGMIKGHPAGQNLGDLLVAKFGR